MKCDLHKTHDAVGMCVKCGKPACSDCIVDVSGRNHCKTCLKKGGTVSDNPTNPTFVLNNNNSSGATSSSSASSSSSAGKIDWVGTSVAVAVCCCILLFFMGGLGA